MINLTIIDWKFQFHFTVNITTRKQMQDTCFFLVKYNIIFRSIHVIMKRSRCSRSDVKDLRQKTNKS